MADHWVEALRHNVQVAAGRGWTVSPNHGRAKLFVSVAGGGRRSISLGIPWEPGEAGVILTAVRQIALATTGGLPLEAAAVQVLQRQQQAAVKPSSARTKPLEVWEQFGSWKVETGQITASTWQAVYGPTGRRLRELSSVMGAEELLSAAGGPWPAGSRRRQIVLQHLAAMLRWGCRQGLLEERLWQPGEIKEWVGRAERDSDGGVPVTDDQIECLLNSLKTDKAGNRWKYAIQLMATYGLRPVELRWLEVSAGRLWCRYQKRSGGGRTKQRILKPLHPEWESEWKLAIRVERQDELPPLERCVAESLRKYMMRQPYWKELSSKGITGYSFRHGYALRAHQQYGLSARITAALMGHSVETHHRHYGQWTDEATVDAAMEAGITYRQVLRSQL